MAIWQNWLAVAITGRLEVKRPQEHCHLNEEDLVCEVLTRADAAGRTLEHALKMAAAHDLPTTKAIRDVPLSMRVLRDDLGGAALVQITLGPKLIILFEDILVSEAMFH
jgi:hypothetical protein